FLLNVEELVEPRDFEDLVDLRVDVAQDQPAAHRLKLLVQSDQLTESGTGEELHIAEVEQDLAPADLIDQAKQLLADHLNDLFVENAAIDEIHDGYIADVFHLQATPTRRLRHRQTPSGRVKPLRALCSGRGAGESRLPEQFLNVRGFGTIVKLFPV